jgi:multidrug efflux pump subunit AcrB
VSDREENGAPDGEGQRLGLAGGIVRRFIDNPVTPLLVLLAVLAGAVALAVVPREEEPQIRVPLVDVIVAAPGLSASDAVEEMARPLEDILAGIEGVDHVYARVQDGQVVVSARFFPGTDSDDAVLRVIERIGANGERRPPGIPEPLIVGRGIEDVAVIAFAVAPEPGAEERYGRADVHAVAEELRWRMTAIDRVGLTYVVGSGPVELRVEPDPEALARLGLAASALTDKIAAANAQLDVGDLLSGGDPRSGGGRLDLRAGRGLAGPDEIGKLVVGTADGRPVYVRDVARVVVAAPQPGPLVWTQSAGEEEARPAAVLAVAKRPGANGVEVAQAALEILGAARDDVVPADMQVTVTRNYGETASQNARDLLIQLVMATVTIVLLIALAVGLREATVMAVVIPVTILLTFFALWAMGYTINRVSLFALIFSIGILVDDAIVVVENISRHWQQKTRNGGTLPRDAARDAAVRAVDEVGNPTILSTLTIVAALLPMLAVSGLMGPYMSPIPANASAAVGFSTAVALTATPWLLLRLRGLHLPLPARWRDRMHGTAGSGPGGWMGRGYLKVARPLLATPRRALVFLLAMLAVTLASLALFAFGFVTVKLLPFDDKREVQVVVDLPESATVETTDRVLREAAARILPIAEVQSVQLYAGTSAPFNFNGLVRQYYLREAPYLGDLKVNLSDPADRDAQSHDIAMEIRRRLADLPAPEGTAVRIAEVPPGPPVFATLLAEVYGPTDESRRETALRVRQAFAEVEYVVDIDDTIGTRRPRLSLLPDRAAMERLDVEEGAVVAELRALLESRAFARTSARTTAGAWPLRLELSRRDRGELARLLAAPVIARDGSAVELSQVVRVEDGETDLPAFRRNGRPVVMVLATLAGAREAPIYGMLEVADRLEAAGQKIEIRLRGQPLSPERPILLWHGEWDITYTTFRDMGGAFLVAFFVIYAIVVAHFGRLKVPLAIMLPVPLTLVGVLLGHWLLGATFSATSMIGFIALAGIVVRNSILLVEFVEERRGHGTEVRDAALEAGAVRFRPILLTAVTAMIGALFIMADPIFKGLAVSLFFGLMSSTLLTTLAIPALYVWRRGDGRARRATAPQ